MNVLVEVGKGRQRAADLSARGVAVGVQDAGQRVRAFASAQQLAVLAIEGRPPLDQLGHPHRTLGHQHLGGGAENQPIAGVDRILEVQRGVLIAPHGDSDPTLRVMSVGLGHGLLGDHQDLAVARQFDGRAQPGHARPYHQKIHLGSFCHNLTRLPPPG